MTTQKKKNTAVFSVLLYFVSESLKDSDFTIYLVIAVFCQKIFPHFRCQQNTDSTDISLPRTDTEMPFCSKQTTSEIAGIVNPKYTQGHCV